MNTDYVEARIRRWVEDAVIGLNLCPFARAPYSCGQVRIAILECEDFEDVLRLTFDEASRLLCTEPDELATTLVVFPYTLREFDDFLDAVDAINALLEDTDADEFLQLAHFHPDYQFEGAEPDALENFTNRAPFPIMHLLREDEMSEAIDRHPDPAAIPDQNIARLEALGAEAIAELWRRFL